MKNLTLEQFNAIPHGEIIETGLLPNSPEGIHMTNSDIGDMLQWVAIKNYGNGWEIYCHWDYHSIIWVMQYGDKIQAKNNILKCINADNDVMKLYRH